MRFPCVSILACLVLAWGTLVLAADEPVPAPSSLAMACDQATLDPEAVQVENLPFHLGNLAITLARGDVAVVRVKGVPAGLFLRGTGRIAYLSRNREEFPLFIHNLTTNTRLSPKRTDDGVGVEDALKDAVVWYGGLAVPEVKGTRVPSDAAAFAENRDFFSRRSWRQTGTLLALRAVNAPAGSVTLVEALGETSKFVHVKDEAVGFMESLDAARNLDLPGFRDLKQFPLSEIQLKATRSAPLPPQFLLRSLDLDIQASSGTFARIRAGETLEATIPGQRLLRFDQVPNLVHWAKDAPELQQVHVSRISLGGAALPFFHRGNDLLVELPAPLEAGNPVKLDFEMEGAFLSRQGSAECWILGTQAWFPQPDLAGQAYTVHCRLSVDRPYIPFAPGHVLREEQTPTATILETSLDRPVCFYSLGAGKYAVREYRSPRDAVDVRLYGYDGFNEADAERLAMTIHGFIGFYESFLGKFPFDTFDVVEQTQLGHGQAPPALMLITREAFNPKEDLVAEVLAHQWINLGVAHEVAHQYWGHVVKMYAPEDQWITKSFAEYCAGLAMRQVKGSGADRFKRAQARWRNLATIPGDKCSIPLANRLRGDKSGDMRYGLLYAKGPLVLGAIHKELGEDGFARFLNAYQRSYAWKASTTQDIPDLLRQLTGRDWNPFFDKYYWGVGQP